jgi:hypothetical protein
MFATDLLDAASDERFVPMVTYLRAHYGMLMGITGNMKGQEHGDRPGEWYVNSSERGFFKNYLARGETEKALLFFYSTLVYGLSHDCYQTVERILVSDPNFAPFQPNASGNGRLLDMMRRMVIDEQDPGKLWLLRGCPRRWFADGQSIDVKDAPTYFGKMSFHMAASGKTIRVDIDAPCRVTDLKNPSPSPRKAGEREYPCCAGYAEGGCPNDAATLGTLQEMRIVLRHPEGKTPAKVEVNGKRWTQMEGDAVILPKPEGKVQVTAYYD